MNKTDSIKIMNRLGKSKTPFLFIIDFEMIKCEVYELSKLPNYIKFQINLNNYITHKITRPNFYFNCHLISKTSYKKKYDKVLYEIKYGNTYLLNLTASTKIETDLSLNEIYQNSQSKYKLLYNNNFVVFSPETFVKIENGKIFSFPMKGTIDASIDGAHEILMNDDKEIAEHYTIVDLIRNDLSMVSKNVQVEKFRYIEEIQTNTKNLLQASSKIAGELSPNYIEEIGDLIFTLLPAGSISGAPKKKTLEIIKNVEEIPRGFYTGVFGIFDGLNLDSAVMIRFIENTNSNFYYRSGGGITALSNVDAEYQELIDKVYVPFF